MISLKYYLQETLRQGRQPQFIPNGNVEAFNARRGFPSVLGKNGLRHRVPRKDKVERDHLGHYATNAKVVDIPAVQE